MTRRCAVCRLILYDGGPGAQISDGIGPECWAAYRASLGLKPRAYPTEVTA